VLSGAATLLSMRTLHVHGALTILLVVQVCAYDAICNRRYRHLFRQQILNRSNKSRLRRVHWACLQSTC
jgi:uncharacterized membrane protein